MKFIYINQKAKWAKDKALGDARIYRDFFRVFLIQYDSLALIYEEGIENLCGDTVILNGKE
jgi:hypothetical protein